MTPDMERGIAFQQRLVADMFATYYRGRRCRILKQHEDGSLDIECERQQLRVTWAGLTSGQCVPVMEDPATGEMLTIGEVYDRQAVTLCLLAELEEKFGVDGREQGATQAPMSNE